MIYHTPTLREWPCGMVRLACDLCPRRGQLRKSGSAPLRYFLYHSVKKSLIHV
jgi:hypothetical protein